MKSKRIVVQVKDWDDEVSALVEALHAAHIRARRDWEDRFPGRDILDRVDELLAEYPNTSALCSDIGISTSDGLRSFRSFLLAGAFGK